MFRPMLQPWLRSGLRPWLGAALLSASFAAVPAAAQSTPVMLVFFPLWSGALDDAAKAVIDQAATAAKQQPNAHVTVTGYADTRGSSAADQDLSQLRAQRVVDQLEAAGIPAAQLELVAKGAQPDPGVASRRVEIAISAGQ